MTEAKYLFDTNMWVYLYSFDPKGIIVQKLINTHFDNIVVSTQVLNELYNVLTRKNLKTKEDAYEIVNDLIENYNIYCIDEQCIKRGVEINIKYHFSYWDSLIIAAALETGCSTLYSEDLQHKQVIEETVTVLNPFS
ncbi:MAG: PIN domain-containing protein [Desulfamplus sp.]|nr:PIN domain-containing protein [Desulfamplus sp.]